MTIREGLVVIFLPLILTAAILTAQIPRQTLVFAPVTGLIPHLDVFQVTSQSFGLNRTPAPNLPVKVYVNGLLMLGGTDYTLGVASITFTGQVIGDNPIIQVEYWTTN